MAGPEGGEKGVAGEKRAKKPENLANPANCKTPNSNLGKGRWFEAIAMEEFLKRVIKHQVRIAKEIRWKTPRAADS